MNKANTATVKMALLRQFTGEIAMKAKTRKDRLFQRTRVAGLLLAVCSMLGSSGAAAADNTVKFKVIGSIEPGTCQMRAGDRNKPVALPEVRVADFAHGGSAGARDDFSIVVENCRGVTEAELPLGAAYWKTGAVMGGTLNSVVGVTMTYR